MVFAGDHIMNGSTVVIVPPGGNMADYIASLRRLLDYDVKVVAPGHGELISDCRGEVEKLVRHRLMREAKVASALDSVPQSLDGLVVTVYDDVDPVMHEWAKLSLLAHLIKLEGEGRALKSSLEGVDHWGWQHAEAANLDDVARAVILRDDFARLGEGGDLDGVDRLPVRLQLRRPLRLLGQEVVLERCHGLRPEREARTPQHLAAA